MRRTVTINLNDAIVHKICPSDNSDFALCENNQDPTDHSSDRTLGDYIAAQELDSIMGADSVRHVTVAFFETSSGLSRGGFQVAYCGGLGFVDEGTWGLYALTVDNSDPSHVHIETQEGPDRNVASCGHYDTKWDDLDGNPNTPTPLVLLLHVDIAYDVIDKL